MLYHGEGGPIDLPAAQAQFQLAAGGGYPVGQALLAGRPDANGDSKSQTGAQVR